MRYAVRARNHSINTENKIHDDEVARSLGFEAGLVPGVTIFAYMTHPVVGTYGLEWFNCGTMSVRFERPVYDSDAVEVRAGEEEASGMLLSVITANGERAYGRADLSRRPAEPADFDAHPLATLPAARPSAGALPLAPGTVLGTVMLGGDRSSEAVYRDEIGDDLPIYEAEQLIHPARLLHGCNLALSQNVAMGPWIHAGSEISMFSPARFGEVVQLRPLVRHRFEKKGHKFVVLDILASVGERPVMHCLHTAIYQLRLPRASSPRGAGAGLGGRSRANAGPSTREG